MEQIVWKNKMTALWLLQVVNFVVVLTNPGSLASTAAQVGNALGPLINAYFFVFALLIWLCVFCRPSVSRWPMMICGALIALVKVQWIVSALRGDLIVEFFLNEVWGLVVGLMIVWVGWKGPAKAAAGQQ